MKLIDSEHNQHKDYREDLEEVISILEHAQSIISALKMSTQEKKNIYQLDPVQIRKENELLKNGISVLGEMMNGTWRV